LASWNVGQSNELLNREPSQRAPDSLLPKILMPKENQFPAEFHLPAWDQLTWLFFATVIEALEGGFRNQECCQHHSCHASRQPPFPPGTASVSWQVTLPLIWSSSTKTQHAMGNALSCNAKQYVGCACSKSSSYETR
jgi:hypothetical protein